MKWLLKYSKSHKLTAIYVVYVCVAVVMGFYVKESFKVEFKINSVVILKNVSTVIVALLILAATTISLYAIYKFDKEKEIIVAQASEVGVGKTVIKKIEKCMKFATCRRVRNAMVLSLGLGYSVVSIASNNKWDRCTCAYATLLVGTLIGATLYGYIYFFIIIMCMRRIYEEEFEKYIYVYPLATEVFGIYNRICTYGLVCFWAIGIILIFLSLVVFDKSSWGLLLIIGALILAGYVFFTFYPYYLTRKKVSLLKLQTIRILCSDKDMLKKENYDNYIEMIKSVSESPTILSTNFNLVLTSTLTAIAGMLTSILTLWK